MFIFCLPLLLRVLFKKGDEEHELSASDDRVLDGLIESLVAAGRNVTMVSELLLLGC
jgi:hypothetical protein